MTRPPSLLPLTDGDSLEIHDGTEISSPNLCRRSIRSDSRCERHYKSHAPHGYSQCPFGFTTRSFPYSGKTWFVSGVIAHPRFQTTKETAIAKQFPRNRISRSSIDATVLVAVEIDAARAAAIVEAAKVLPQAFHELRKLNGSIIQHSERAIEDGLDERRLLSIKSAAELMRNNFDILEALSNIEGMRTLPLDGTVSLFDLAFKMKRVYQEKAASRNLSISVLGSRAIIKGSQKSFPLVPAVLLENALKYSEARGGVTMTIVEKGSRAQLIVENRSIHALDPRTCFDKGVRFANGIEGGGFGLHLAREVVEAHDGTISCQVDGDLVRMIVDLPMVGIAP